jgi:hypothetical protein
MNYILDAGVAFEWVVQEADSAKAIQLRTNYRNAIHHIIVPNFFPFELGNALRNAERQKIIKPPDGWA